MPKIEERRRYIRLRVPINITCVIQEGAKVLEVVSKDISAVGVRFETKEKLSAGNVLELTLELPQTPNPVHAKGKVVWCKKVSLEDTSPYDVGIEFTKIEEDNKNTFLKYLCDLIYNPIQR